MGWFADSMRLRDALNVVSSIEIPLPAVVDRDTDPFGDQLGDRSEFDQDPPLAA
jgi:hypothetical protein